jgi:GNAT superfamily N-acetyltransferase
MTSAFITEPLGRQHDRAAFRCGVPALDRYLQQQARQDKSKDLSSTFVLLDPTSGAIRGYYSLATTAVERAALPDAITGKLTRQDPLPAFLIGRLAIHQDYQGQKLGTILMADVLKRCIAGCDIGASGTVVVVDAKGDRARTFYEQFGFRRFTDDEYRLFMMVSTARQLVR